MLIEPFRGGCLLAQVPGRSSLVRRHVQPAGVLVRVWVGRQAKILYLQLHPKLWGPIPITDVIKMTSRMWKHALDTQQLSQSYQLEPEPVSVLKLSPLASSRAALYRVGWTTRCRAAWQGSGLFLVVKLGNSATKSFHVHALRAADPRRRSTRARREMA